MLPVDDDDPLVIVNEIKFDVPPPVVLLITDTDAIPALAISDANIVTDSVVGALYFVVRSTVFQYTLHV